MILIVEQNGVVGREVGFDDVGIAEDLVEGAVVAGRVLPHAARML